MAAGLWGWRRYSLRDDTHRKGAGRARLVRHEAPPDDLGGAPDPISDRAVASPPSSTLISLSQLTSRALLDLAVPQPPSTARSMPFDPAAVCLDCLFVPLYGSLCGCGLFACASDRGRGLSAPPFPLTLSFFLQQRDDEDGVAPSKAALLQLSRGEAGWNEETDKKHINM